MNQPAIGSELIDEAGSRRFRLLQRLGAGGFGEVWLCSVCSPSGLEQRVAIKLLHGRGDEALQAAERLRDEALMLARLHHPVILVAHDLVQLGEQRALVTEYVEGEDLGRCIHHKLDPVPVGALLDALGQVSSALDSAWRTLQVVHRDIKPQNIRIGRHGNVKLLDFGIARSEMLHLAAQTSRGVVGSPGFLAPERFDASRALHPGSDVFSLGSVLYEGVTRTALFRGMDMAMVFGLSQSRSKLDAHVEQALEREMPEPVRALLRQALAHDPDERIDAAAFSQMCDAVLAALDGAVTLRRWCRDHPWPAPTVPMQRVLRPALPGPDDPPTVITVNREISRVAPPPALQSARTQRIGARAVAVAGLSVAMLVPLPFAAAAVLLLGWLVWPPAPPRDRPEPVDPPLVESPELPDAPTDEDGELPDEPPDDPPVDGPAAPGPVVPREPVAPPPAERVVDVLVVGGAGCDFYLDGQRIGSTNDRYPLPLGAHRCEIRNEHGKSGSDCEIREGQRQLILPEPPLPPLPPVRIRVVSKAPVEFREPEGHSVEAAALSAGKRYEIFLLVPDKGWTFAGDITPEAGRETTVRCNTVRSQCTAE